MTVFSDGVAPPTGCEGEIAKLLERIAEGEGVHLKDVNVILTNDSALQDLNIRWLGIDTATDVLAFELHDEGSDTIEGDIYISVDTAQAQAHQNGIRLTDELLRLAAHGMLHLCGYNHEDEAALMDMIDRGDTYIRLNNQREALGG